MKNERSQEANFLNDDILADSDSKGRSRDWRGKKIASQKLSKVYEKIAEEVGSKYAERGVHKRYKKITHKVKDKAGRTVDIRITRKSMGLYDKDGKRVINYEKRAGDMKFCSSYLQFAVKGDGLKKLIDANFCRVSLCPMCQWRRSMRTFFEVSKIMKIVKMRNPHYVSVFLTLTVKNCSLESLSKTLDNMFGGWNEFMRSGTLKPMTNGKVTNIVKGWFRALEVTYDGDEYINQRRYNSAKKYYDERGIKVGDENPNYNTFHPHFHAIMLVERQYFTGKDYMQTKDWVQLWRKSARLDYDPVCDIRRTRTSKEKRKDVAEVAKYTYKDAEILSKRLSDEKQEAVVKSLSSALHGRRLYAYGGEMKAIAAELKKLNSVDEEADLIKVNDDNNNLEMSTSLVTMIMTYRWNIGVSNYVLDRKTKINKNREAEDC